MPFQLVNMSISEITHLGSESCMTSIILGGTLLCLDIQLLLNTSVCYKKMTRICGYLSTWILGSRKFPKRPLSSHFKAPYLPWQKILYNCSPLFLGSGRHSLTCILICTAQQNPMLVTKNAAELRSSWKHSGFQKLVLYCCLHRLCYLHSTLSTKAIIRLQKNPFINKCVCVNACAWIVFVACCLCSWLCFLCSHTKYILFGPADHGAPVIQSTT